MKETGKAAWAEMVENWRADPGFRSRMEADPRAALSEHGIDVPEDVDVRLAVDGEDVIHVVAPPDPNRVMADEVLQRVVGGVVGSVGCTGSAIGPDGIRLVPPIFAGPLFG